MSIDGGEPIAPALNYNFATTGSHILTLYFKDDCNSVLGLFQNCKNLAMIDGTHFNARKITNAAFAFNGCSCSSLRQVTGFENWDFSQIGEFFTPPGVFVVGTGGRATESMFQSCSSLQEMIIPNKCIEISKFMYNHCSSAANTEVYIPASVKKIGASHCFYDCGKPGVFKRFVVDPANTTFKSWNGILMSIDGTELYSIPRALEVAGTTLELPEGITKFGELSFSVVNTFTKLILPNSYVITEECKGDMGIGINTGSSLAVAIYCNTTVKEYEVKASNPTYMSDSGCIYSKDGTHLVSVPYKYTGVLFIKEGCTHINKNAFWTCDGYAAQPMQTSLHIPASVTSIESGQITLINNAVTKGTLTITIDAGNPVYAVSDGKIITK